MLPAYSIILFITLGRDLSVTFTHQFPAVSFCGSKISVLLTLSITYKYNYKISFAVSSSSWSQEVAFLQSVHGCFLHFFSM